MKKTVASKYASYLIIIFLVAACILPSNHANAQFNEQVTTPEIIAASTNFSCMQWRITGICIWLDCGITGCSVEVSQHIEHFSPSLVVSAYNANGGSPWIESRATHGTISTTAHNLQFTAQGINMNRESPGNMFIDRNIASDRVDGATFKAADAIGSPGNIATIAGGFGLPFFCPTTDIAPFFPYFLSGIDAIAWTSGVTELIFAASWIPGLREIGSRKLTNPLGNTWGSVHPRRGMIDQPDDVKAGAVIAQRAADIVYKEAQPHLYARVGSVPGFPDGGFRVYEPGPLEENNEEDTVWQMLVPKREDECEAFGRDDRFSILGDAVADGRFSTANYTYNLWRAYACCEDLGVFVTRIVF